MCKRNLHNTLICREWRQHQGTTLIEVLVTALILGIGVLGMLKLQSYGLLLAQTALQRQTATLLLMDLSERVRIDSQAYRHIDDAFLNNPSPQTAICLDDSRCTSGQLAQHLVIDWKNSAAALLPDAEVSIYRLSVQGVVSWQVSIGWFSDAGEIMTGRIVL